MATKDAMLRKQLLREGIFSLVVLAVLSGAGYFLSNYDDDSLNEKQTRDGENASLKGQREAIRQDLGTGFEVSAYFDTYSKSHNPDFRLNREAASTLLNTLREKNHIANLSVTISPITDTVMDAVHLRSGVLTRSDVKLTFVAVSDGSIYSFIESLQKSLPGLVVMKEVKFSRAGELSSAVVVGLSQHHLAPLVSGEISFVWLGVRPDETAEKTAGGPPGQNPGGMR